MEMKHTPGPWIAYHMTHAERGDNLTPEELGEYVCNSVKKSALASGTTDFLFVSAEKPDGPADVCHVGNGPTSPANAKLIAAAPDLLHALTMVRDADEDCKRDGLPTIPAPARACIDAALAKAEGKG